MLLKLARHIRNDENPMHVNGRNGVIRAKGAGLNWFVSPFGIDCIQNFTYFLSEGIWGKGFSDVRDFGIVSAFHPSRITGHE